METQKIGMDIGRGYTKAYSMHKGTLKTCKFKSAVVLGRALKFSDYEDPIYISINNSNVGYFAGALAEFEGKGKGQNLIDDKTNFSIEILLCAALQEVAIAENVDVMLGVPKKIFTEQMQTKVEKKYKGKTYSIKNKIDGSTKNVRINDILICREADAALMAQVNQYPSLKNGAVGMAVMGFRTLELAYYDKGFRFNDAKSKTFELGNITTLEYVQTWLAENGVMKSLGEIDTSDDYDDLKREADRMTHQELLNLLEATWINLTDIPIFCAGGTMINLSKLDDFSYDLIDNPQLAVAKGLYIVAKVQF